VDIIVTVSSTGIATPSLEARAMARMGFRPDAARVRSSASVAPAGHGPGAGQPAGAAQPGATVLLVCVEICSLAFSMDDPSKADIVATALFGDGAAAVVLKAGADGFAQVDGGPSTPGPTPSTSWAGGSIRTA
jgi:alkylresorcinol/alkylpyrone synthase